MNSITQNHQDEELLSKKMYVSRCSRWGIFTLEVSAFAAGSVFVFKQSIWTIVQSHCSSVRLL